MGTITALRPNKEREYLPVTETAQILRRVLKEAFPGIKFAVKTKKYSGGSSIRIEWTDGPTVAQVKDYTQVFEGAYFDSMTDYKGHQYALFDGQPVHFGADFIFENRDHGEAAITEAIDTVWSKYGVKEDKPTAHDYNQGLTWGIAVFANSTNYNCDGAQTEIRKALTERTFYPEPKKSPTRNRVTFAGENGYSKSMGTHI
jgi:hypothetical protein